MPCLGKNAAAGARCGVFRGYAHATPHTRIIGQALGRYQITGLTHAIKINRTYNGHDHLRDLFGPSAPVSVEKWAQAPGSTTFSFQHVLVPLLHVLTSESIRKSVLDLEQRALCGTLRVQGRRLADPKEVLSEHDKLQLTKVAKSLGRIKKKPPPTQQIFEASTAAMRKMGTSAKIAQHLVMRPPAKGIVMEVKIIWI